MLHGCATWQNTRQRQREREENCTGRLCYYNKLETHDGHHVWLRANSGGETEYGSWAFGSDVVEQIVDHGKDDLQEVPDAKIRALY